MRKESNFLRFHLKKVKWNAFKALNKSYFYVCGLSECWPLGVSSRQSFCAIIIVVSMTRLGYFLKAIVSFHSNKSSPNIEQPFWTISKSISFNEKTVMATFWASLGKFGQVLFYLYHLVTLFVVKILTISRKLFWWFFAFRANFMRWKLMTPRNLIERHPTECCFCLQNFTTLNFYLLQLGIVSRPPPWQIFFKN